MSVCETVLESNGVEPAVEVLKENGEDSPENMSRFEMNLRDTRYMRDNCLFSVLSYYLIMSTKTSF